MAKPTPMLPDCSPIYPPPVLAIAVVMPTTWPTSLTRAPPELPGLIAVSVWITLLMTLVDGDDCPGKPPYGWLLRLPTVIVRCSAEMIPEVTDPVRPSGLPMASTVSPTCSPDTEPKAAGTRSDTPEARMTARSTSG